MIHLISCNGYKTIALIEDKQLESLPDICDAWERKINDGYAVFATQNSVIVADSEGFADKVNFMPDAATQTGMYDRYF